jgi:hypothetical protein
MLKISRLLVIGIFAVIVASGCGQQTAGTSTTTTTLPATGGVTISGNLYSGTVRASAAGVRAMADADSPIADYTVVAVGTKDGKIYFPDAKTKTADGSFSISVPSGESFYLEVIDDKKKFVAPVSFGVSADKVVMAVTPETSATIDLGKIVYESAKGAAVPTAELGAALLDESSTARKKSSDAFVPVGAGILGRGTGEAFYSGILKDKIDEDDDGLPDVVDVDDDGDGKVDGLDPSPRLGGRVEVKLTGLNNTNAFSNLALPYENYPTYQGGSLNTAPIDVATQTNLAIEIVMSPGTDPATFSDVRVVEGPAWIETAKIASDSPPDKVNTLWKDSGNALYKSTDRWQVHVTPNGTPEAGDVLKFRVTTSSGSEEFIATLTYVFKDIPRLVAYSYTDGANLVTKESADLNLNIYQAGVGGTANVFGYKGSEVTFIFTAPKDDGGSYITGMNYYLDGIVYNGTSLPGTSKSITPIVVTGYPDFGTVNVYTFTPTTDAFTSFKVDLKAQSPTSGGGNASQMVNFKKI